MQPRWNKDYPEGRFKTVISCCVSCVNELMRQVGQHGLITRQSQIRNLSPPPVFLVA